MDKSEALAKQMVEAVRSAIAKSVTPLLSRIDDLEARLKAVPIAEKGERGEPGRDGKDGKDGVGEKGEKGDPGKDGASVHPDTVELMIRNAAERLVGNLPKPKDGADGFSLEDFDVSLSDDGRTLSFKFQRGELKRERAIKLETMIYREVWREGEYERGDVVTWGGSAWYCKQQTTEKPSYGCKDWKLMVKEGRPGKDGGTPAAPQHKVVRTA